MTQVKFLSFLFLGFISGVFGLTYYSINLDELANNFELSNNRFMTNWEDISESDYFEFDKNEHIVNLATYVLRKNNLPDSSKIAYLDSLLNLVQSKDSVVLSVLYNQQIMLQNQQVNKSNLLTAYPKIDQKTMDAIDGYCNLLKNALRLDPTNKQARHNLYVLSTFFQENDLYYQTAQKLSTLIHKQLSADLKSNQSVIENEICQWYLSKNKSLLEQIIPIAKQKEAKTRICDSIKVYIDSLVFKKQVKKCTDSLVDAKNLDLYFLKKLKSKQTSECIIDEFYATKYPLLYSEDYAIVPKKLQKDTIAKRTVQEILCEYLPEECKKEERNKNETTQNTNSKNQNQDGKKQEMKEQMKALDQQKQEQKEAEEKRKEEASKPNNSQNTPSTQGSQMTKNEANEAMKRIEEQNNTYQKQKIEQESSEDYDENKPSW